MKLGIAVVYLVTEDNGPLLDLHLDYIDKHTRAPYTIYGAANRLLPQFRPRLENHPRVVLCDIPPTDERGLYENAYYLERLMQRAVDDGCTHLVTFHVDSFPIRSGWAEELAALLDERCVLTAALNDVDNERRPNTCFMFFTADFHRRYHPEFLAPPEVFSTPEYEAYRREFPHRAKDSGVGYGFKIWSEGLTWHELPKTNEEGGDSFFGAVHGDLVFHLGAAAGPLKLFPGAEKAPAYRIRHFVTTMLPEAIRSRLRALPRSIKDYMYPDLKLREAAFRSARRRLFDDPDSYLDSLRAGRN